MNQLEKGKEWLKHIMKMLNIKHWKNTGFVAFPNIDNREALREAGLDLKGDELKVCVCVYEQTANKLHCFFKMIMTKYELYDPEYKVWIEMVRKIDRNPANGETLFTALYLR